MLTFILYLFIAAVISWIFKIVAAIIETISMSMFGLFADKLEENILTKPKRFFTVLVVKNTFLGLLNSYIILYATVYIFINYNVTHWIYITFALIWSLYILRYSGMTPWIYFFTSTINLGLLFLGFGYLTMFIIGFLTIAVSLPYHFGRINTLISQYKEQDTYEL